MVRRIALALLASTALAQAQDVTNHAIPIGKGAGVIGWNSGGPCTAGQSLVWSNNTSDPVCATASSAGGTVASVNNGDGTMTVSPTTGVSFISLNLAHANTWTAIQSFSPSLALNGATSGAITLTAPAVAGTNTATFPANTGTVAEVNLAQSWTANQTFSQRVIFNGGIVAAVRSSGAASVTIVTTDYFLCLDPTSNAIAVALPAGPTTGQTFVVKDCTGQATTHNITVTPASGNIDNQSNYIISLPFQSAAFTYTGSQWSLN